MAAVEASEPSPFTGPPQGQDVEPDEQVQLTITHHAKQHTFNLSRKSTLADLAVAIESEISIPQDSQKFLVPKHGLLKPPFDSTSLPSLEVLSNAKKIQLLAPTAQDLQSLAEGSSKSLANRKPSPIPAAKPARARPSPTSLTNSIKYTFHRLAPLSYLPDPDRSERFLARLRDDPGIRAAMVAHRFSVELLTEMDPAMHTTHESKTLGLNRNKGEVIELRLRTDAYDGYRDYRTIRKTLCHELAHNVHGEHDRNFWDLTNQIEREVERADWKHGGRTVGHEEFYNPDDGGAGNIDGGGWTGGSFVLGGGDGSGSTNAAQGSSPAERRDAIARAAEERARKAKDEKSKDGKAER
jgi:WLM domain